MGPKKVKKVKKSQKKSKKKKNFWSHLVTKMLIKCSINPKKSHYRPKKSKKSKKFKKVKKIYFIFHIFCEKKSHLYIYFLNFGPLPHLKNPYYENVNFFQKIKFSSNQHKNLKFISILWCPPM